jgi:bifunctional DNA-binding transcriptional regulator/antitoxin component of YhaV-PrlF toxin-antitoxin module
MKHGERFYGTATIGERGQAVIPAEARKAMKLAKGQKLLVFGFGPDLLALAKLSDLERLASHMAERLESIRRIVGEAKPKSGRR